MAVRVAACRCWPFGAALPWAQAIRRSDTVTVPGQPDMQMILQQAQKMQRRLAHAQEELASATVTGQAGNGLVTVTTLATGEVQGVTIDPKVVDPSDVETLQDL